MSFVWIQFVAESWEKVYDIRLDDVLLDSGT